ncbi:MAG: DMT family transporter [Campylobacteraceae bacterium]
MGNLSQKSIALICVGLCIFLWSFVGVFAKFAQTGLDNYQYVFYSSVFSFLSLLILSIATKKIKLLFTYPFQTLLFLAFLGFLDFMFYLLLYYGYASSNGLEVLVMQYTWPIFIVLLSLVLLKEKLTINKTLSLIFGFFAMVVVVTKGDVLNIDFTNIRVIFIVMFSAFCFALFSVLSKKVKINIVNAVTVYFLVATIYSFIAMQTFSHFVLPQKTEWFYTFINGVFINGVSYILWVKALKDLDASYVAPFTFLIPILAAFLLVLFFREDVYISYIVGLALIVLSGLANTKLLNKLINFPKRSSK